MTSLRNGWNIWLLSWKDLLKREKGLLVGGHSFKCGWSMSTLVKWYVRLSETFCLNVAEESLWPTNKIFLHICFAWLVHIMTMDLNFSGSINGSSYSAKLFPCEKSGQGVPPTNNGFSGQKQKSHIFHMLQTLPSFETLELTVFFTTVVILLLLFL